MLDTIPASETRNTITVDPNSPTARETPQCVRKTVVVRNEQGLHMRPASRLAEMAQKFTSAITVRKGDHAANGRSMVNLLLLIVEPGCELTVEADGQDAEAAVEALVEFLGREDWD
ncbi:HPr family phosphocarrier protein [Telmatocola sphagniphila]|uniref:Phosphocarrier protein HPr n=1 Tax=Telmatocola sphagniphila TaxID=1123043 RepID=A0A8E6B1I6_9BACT|nr:HPr family phosphocarrier protein [Telmatocola sphagniphila]QVL29881.1 HPr family phosphocarrier protein [Telmatocola sphagniphila]